MQIQAINNFTLQHQEKRPQFKKAYPVVHWVGEAKGSYYPVVSSELTEKLQRILVGFLNGSRRLKQNGAGKKAVEYIASEDKDYSKTDIARSYYDKMGGFDKFKKKFLPLAYLITGGDAYLFNQKFGKPLGKAKANAMERDGRRESAELQIARSNYNIGGWTMVNDPNKRKYDDNDNKYALHTMFEIVRGKKSGKIKGFNLVGIKFCPEKGPDNPFVRTGYLRAEDL